MKKLVVTCALATAVALGAEKDTKISPEQTRAISTEEKLAIRSAELAVSQADNQMERANVALQQAKTQLQRQVLLVEQRNGCVVRNDLSCVVPRSQPQQRPQAVGAPKGARLGTPKKPK